MKLLLVLLFSLTIVQSDSSPLYKKNRGKRQSTFLEGLGGPLAMKPHSKDDMINQTVSPAEASSLSSTSTVPSTMPTRTTEARPTMTVAPIHAADAKKTKESTEKPKVANVTLAKTTTTAARATSSGKTTTVAAAGRTTPTPTNRSTMVTASADLMSTKKATTATAPPLTRPAEVDKRKQIPKPAGSTRPTGSPTGVKQIPLAKKQGSTEKTCNGPIPCCHSWDLMKAILLGRCGCATAANCQSKQQRAMDQRPQETSSNVYMDKLKREIFQEISKQLDSFKKDIMSEVDNKETKAPIDRHGTRRGSKPDTAELDKSYLSNALRYRETDVS